MSSRLSIASTHIVTLTKLRDDENGDYLESSTVVVTLLDAAGAAVVGATDITLTKVVGTSGRNTKYRGVFPSTITLTAQSYTARASITDAVGALRIDEVVAAS